MIDPYLLHAALKAGQVAYLPVLISLLGRLHGQTAQKHGRGQLQIIIGALIDDGACQAAINAQRKILLDGQQLNRMIFAIGNHLKAVHRGHRIVADIIANAYASIEQLDGQMGVLSIVHEYAILLGAAEHNGDIRLRPRAQRLQFDKRIVVDKTDAGQILAPFARIAGMALAQIVGASGIWLEADAVLALVILAGRSLRIHHGDHVVTLTVFARKIVGALANIIIDAVDAGAAILAHMILAVIDVIRAVDAVKARHALAAVVGEVIQALGAIRTGIIVETAELYFRVAPFARKAGLAFAAIRLDAINAGGIVLAAYILAQAVIDVRLAAGARVARRTLAAKATLLQHRAGGIIPAGIAVAGIDHVLAMLAMVARLAEALIVTLWQGQALGLVLARLLVAGIALGQDLVAHLAAAREIRRGRRQYQLILHVLRLRAACYARLHIVQLDPVREPFQ